MNQAAGELRGPLFTPRSVLRISAIFVAAFVLAWGVSQGAKLWCKLSGVPADVPAKWPLSMFEAKLPGVHTPFFELGVSVAVVLLFFIVLRWFLQRITANVFPVLLAGFCFVLCTNLIHGPRYGLVNPHRGEMQYYHDAVRVTSAGRFLREFEETQPQLSCHSRTHPPGAVLFIYGLVRAVGHPAAISIVIAALAVGLSGVFLYGVLSHEFDRGTCGYVTLLFLLIPSVQIYYCATLDAVAASGFLGVLLFFRHANTPLSIGGTIASLFCASFLTFGACFLVPVLVGFDIITQRSLRKSIAVILGVGILYVVIYLLSGFNYLGAFRTASALENPHGFLLFAEPVSYVMTRLENCADIVVFFGPFLLLLFVRGVRTMLRARACPQLLALTGLGTLTLLAMFLTGAFKTGETARVCLFIYPYLMFPVAAYLHQRGCPAKDRKPLLWLVFGQSILMQTVAGYFW